MLCQQTEAAILPEVARGNPWIERPERPIGAVDRLKRFDQVAVGPAAFSLWMAGGGIKGGQVHGETDDFAWNVTRDPVSMHDFHATILHLFGLDHNKLSYRFQGLDFRLTGVNPANVVKGLIA